MRVNTQQYTSTPTYLQVLLTCLFEQNDMTWPTTQYSYLDSNMYIVHSMHLYSKSDQVGSKSIGLVSETETNRN